MRASRKYQNHGIPFGPRIVDNQRQTRTFTARSRGIARQDTGPQCPNSNQPFKTQRNFAHQIPCGNPAAAEIPPADYPNLIPSAEIPPADYLQTKVAISTLHISLAYYILRPTILSRIQPLITKHRTRARNQGGATKLATNCTARQTPTLRAS